MRFYSYLKCCPWFWGLSKRCALSDNFTIEPVFLCFLDQYEHTHIGRLGCCIFFLGSFLFCAMLIDWYWCSISTNQTLDFSSLLKYSAVFASVMVSLNWFWCYLFLKVILITLLLEWQIISSNIGENMIRKNKSHIRIIYLKLNILIDENEFRFFN